MTVRAETPRRGLWRTEIVRAVLSGHSILGIAFAAIIYLVCLSGTLCVFTRDWQRWEQPAAPVVQTVSDAAIGRAIVAMGTRTGPGKGIFITLPNGDLPRLVLSTGDDADDQTWIANANGNLVIRQSSPWSDFLVSLHTSLMLPETWGRFIVGLAGVALLSSLISGVLAHPRVFRDAFHLRLGGARRLEQADLHNRLGVWPLPFHVLISLTGALLGLSTLIVGVLAMLLFRGDTQQVYRLLYAPPPIADARVAPIPGIAVIIAQARQHAPGAQPRQMTVTHWGRRDMRIAISSARPGYIAIHDQIIFDVTGHVVSEKHPADQNVGTEILGSLGPLHFGWFGGPVIRVVYGLLGLALCVVTSSGINVWLARRRDKGRPAPALECVWSAIAWGQPLVLTITALAAVHVGRAGILTAVWLLATILAIGASALCSRLGRDQLTMLWQAATAKALFALGFAAAWLRPVTTDSAAALITVAIFAIGLLFGRAAWRNGIRIRARAA